MWVRFPPPAPIQTLPLPVSPRTQTAITRPQVTSALSKAFWGIDKIVRAALAAVFVGSVPLFLFDKALLPGFKGGGHGLLQITVAAST